MKKIFFLSMISFLMIFTSCSVTKEDRSTEGNFRGNWSITNVSIDGIQESYVSAVVFDEANFQCYRGSRWHFVANNNTGTYSIPGGQECATVNGKIKWFVTTENGQQYFNFKRIYEGEKPKHVLDGYRMRIISDDVNHIVMRQDLSFEGKPLGVIYTFTKN